MVTEKKVIELKNTLLNQIWEEKLVEEKRRLEEEQKLVEEKRSNFEKALRSSVCNSVISSISKSKAFREKINIKDEDSIHAYTNAKSNLFGSSSCCTVDEEEIAYTVNEIKSVKGKCNSRELEVTALIELEDMEVMEEGSGTKFFDYVNYFGEEAREWTFNITEGHYIYGNGCKGENRRDKTQFDNLLDALEIVDQEKK